MDLDLRPCEYSNSVFKYNFFKSNNEKYKIVTIHKNKEL